MGTVARTGISSAVTVRTTDEIVLGELTALGSKPPWSSTSVLSPLVIAWSRHVPLTPFNWILWPTMNPSLIQLPEARVTVPPVAPPTTVTALTSFDRKTSYGAASILSLIHISEPTRLLSNSY